MVYIKRLYQNYTIYIYRWIRTSKCILWD